MQSTLSRRRFVQQTAAAALAATQLPVMEAIYKGARSKTWVKL